MVVVKFGKSKVKFGKSKVKFGMMKFHPIFSQPMEKKKLNFGLRNIGTSHRNSGGQDVELSRINLY